MRMAHGVSACREAKYRWRPSTLICTRRSRSSSGNAHADAAASANVACIRHNEMLFTRNKDFAGNCPAAKHTRAAHKSIVGGQAAATSWYIPLPALSTSQPSLHCCQGCAPPSSSCVQQNLGSEIH